MKIEIIFIDWALSVYCTIQTNAIIVINNSLFFVYFFTSPFDELPELNDLLQKNDNIINFG